MIEFTHRLTSVVAFLGVGGLLAWSHWSFPRNHRVRQMAMVAMALFVVEAALGAGLVLFDYVGVNASGARAFYLSLHLLTTAFLLAALTLTAWFAQNLERTLRWPAPLLLATLPVALLVMVTGTIAALGDTLFPAASLAAGVQQDLSTDSNVLLRLRAAHPAFAIVGAILFVYAAFRFLRTPARRLALAVLGLSMTQVLAGAINIGLLAPTWMQIIHLLLADLTWLALVLLAIEAA